MTKIGKRTKRRSPASAKRARSRERVAAVMARAEQSGLLGNKSGRITSRVSDRLIRQAKARTGLESDSELVEFALANIALEDDFADAFRKLKGTVDSDLALGY
jgi:hypothetical protein